jgi:hypothetical protein
MGTSDTGVSLWMRASEFCHHTTSISAAAPVFPICVTTHRSATPFPRMPLFSVALSRKSAGWWCAGDKGTCIEED